MRLMIEIGSRCITKLVLLNEPNPIKIEMVLEYTIPVENYKRLFETTSSATSKTVPSYFDTTTATLGP